MIYDIDLDYSSPNAVLATSNMTLFNIYAARGCGCPFMGCHENDYAINQMVLRYQWERKTRGLSHIVQEWPHIPVSETPLSHRKDAHMIELFEENIQAKKQYYIDLSDTEINNIIQSVSQRCVPIFRPVGNEISDMLLTLINRKDCATFGCAAAPLTIEAGNTMEVMCLPVSFNPNGPEPVLKYLNMLIQLPPPQQPKIPLKEGEVLRGTGSRTVYLVRDQQLHAFPNADTFIGMGYDWDQIKVYYQDEVNLMPIGSELPPK
jgi:hypothetical protein